MTLDWLEHKLHLDGPKELTEIVITGFEGGQIQYQFTGLNGRPCNPIEIHQMLTAITKEVERVVEAPPRPAVFPSPIPEGVPA